MLIFLGNNPVPRTIIASTVILVIAWFAYNHYNQIDEFPELAVGAYVGDITIDSPEKTKRATLYLERFPNTNIFVAVVFSGGFRPQAILAEELSGRELTSKGLKPLKLLWDDRTLLLVGRAEDGNAHGRILDTTASIGSWRVRAVSSSDLVGATLSLPEGAELIPWLEQKAILRGERRELRDQEDRLKQGLERKSRLEKFVSNEGLLKQRSAERRDALAEELRRVTAERKETAKLLAALVADLELFSRVTRTGQAVTLARRVATRENRWYEANWNVGESSELLEESMAQASGLDTRKFEESVKRANEIKLLLSDIDSERMQVKKLQESASAGSVPGNTPPIEEGLPQPGELPLPPQEEKRNLWDRIFG